MEKYNKLENMMLDIVDYGEQRIKIDIEKIKNATHRGRERILFYKAVEKLNNKLKDK